MKILHLKKQLVIINQYLTLILSTLTNQQISINSLFLYERFETLCVVNSRKMIGVISHVEALKERIPLQIRVMPKGDGRSVLNIN